MRHQKSFESIDTLQTSTSLAASVDDLEDPSQVSKVLSLFRNKTKTFKSFFIIFLKFELCLDF